GYVAGLQTDSYSSSLRRRFLNGDSRAESDVHGSLPGFLRRYRSRPQTMLPRTHPQAIPIPTSPKGVRRSVVNARFIAFIASPGIGTSTSIGRLTLMLRFVPRRV